MTTLTTVLGMIPMAVGSRRGFRDVALDGYDRGLGSFRIHLDYLIYCPTVYAVFAANGVKRRRRQNKKGITK